MNLSNLKTKMLLMEHKNPHFSFITSVMLSLPIEFSKEIETACATKKEILFNPDFLNSCTVDEQVGLLCHETLHVVLDHISRSEGRDKLIWNYSADAVINEICIKELGLKLPKDPITFKTLGISDTSLSTEEVYNILKYKTNNEKLSLGLSIADLNHNHVSKDNTLELPKGEELESILTTSAVLSNFDWSEVNDSELARNMRDLIDPKINWRNQLIGYMFDCVINSEESFDTFNQRMFTLPALMPGQTEEETLSANCYIDISGSLSDENVTEILSEIKGIKDNLLNSKINVITWNTNICKEFTDVKNIKELEIVGKGGTNVACVFQHIEENKPKLAIIFTDGQFSYVPFKSKHTTLIWVINKDTLDKRYTQKIIEME